MPGDQGRAALGPLGHSFRSPPRRFGVCLRPARLSPLTRGGGGRPLPSANLSRANPRRAGRAGSHWPVHGRHDTTPQSPRETCRHGRTALAVGPVDGFTVNPRIGGASMPLCPRPPSNLGASPPKRGDGHRSRQPSSSPRPIPAPAGQRQSARTDALRREGHPRTGGLQQPESKPQDYGGNRCGNRQQTGLSEVSACRQYAPACTASPAPVEGTLAFHPCSLSPRDGQCERERPPPSHIHESSASCHLPAILPDSPISFLHSPTKQTGRVGAPRYNIRQNPQGHFGMAFDSRKMANPFKRLCRSRLGIAHCPSHGTLLKRQAE